MPFLMGTSDSLSSHPNIWVSSGLAEVVIPNANRGFPGSGCGERFSAAPFLFRLLEEGTLNQVSYFSHPG